MASTTIHTLSYKMVADTQQFTRGLVASKSEVALMKKLMGDTSPEDKAAKALEMLNRLYDNGKISADKFKSATMQVEQELKQVQFAASTTGKAISTLNNGLNKAVGITKSVGSQLTTLAAGYVSISKITGNIADQINNIDQIQDLAGQLDSSASSLLKMQYALERGGGLGADEAAEAIKTFSINVSMANMGMGKSLKIFQQMGFEADTLAALNFADPVEKVKIIADELAKVNEPADRLAMIVKLFGTGGDKMAAFFGRGGDAITEMTEKARRLGLVVSDMDAAGIADVVEKTEDLADAWKAFGTVLARDVYPQLTASLKIMTQALQAASYTFSSPEMGGEKPLTMRQRAKLMLGIPAPIKVLGYDVLFGQEPTDEQKKAFVRGQAQRGFDQLRNVTGDMPDFIGRRLDRLIEIGEQQIQNRDEDRKLD